MDSNLSSSHLREYRKCASQDEIVHESNLMINSNSLNQNNNALEININASINQTSFNNISSNNISNNNNLSSKIFINEESNSLNNYKIICKNCSNFPYISFNKEQNLNVICNCRNKSQMDFDYNFENKSNTKIIIENFCQCEYHYKKYLYFCETCSEGLNKISGLNLCEDCIKERNLHSKHIIYYYDNNMNNNITKIVKFIKKYNKDLKNNNPFSNEYINKNFVNFLLILKSILICTKIYFCSNIYKTIESISKFIDDNIFEINHKDNKNEIIKIPKMKQLINIKEKNELKYLTDPKYHNEIKSIEFLKNNFFDISILKNTELINLESLSLSYNNIVNIDPLKSMKAPNLKKLNLSTNLIPDKYIYVIKDMDFPNLIYINLGRNYFHNFNIFTCFEKKNNLEILFIGTNKFEINENNNNNIIKYEFPQSLKKLGVTRGVFSDLTIKLISNFNLINLQKLYISGNNLSSLIFVEHLNCKNLNTFEAAANNFSEYFRLVKFSKLTNISLKNNFIHDISLLLDFINRMKYLSFFDLTNNKIEKDAKYSEIINQIKQLKESERKDISILI